MITRDRIVGVVLAGGGSRRMFGRSPPPDQSSDSGHGPLRAGPNNHKGLIAIGGRPMLGHIIDRIRPQVGHVLLNANGDPSWFAPFGVDIIPDLDDARAGPLAGFAAAMAWAQQHRPTTEVIVTVATDTPFLPNDLVARLLAAGGGAPAIAQSGGQNHPTIGVWPMSLYPAVIAALAGGRRQVAAFAQHHEAIAVSFAFSDIGGRWVDPFFNANTPEDVAAANVLMNA